VNPDCGLPQGLDPDGVYRRELVHVCSQLTSNDTLLGVAAALLPLLTGTGTGTAGEGDKTRDPAPSDETRGSGADALRDVSSSHSTTTESMLALRQAAKQVLHSHGLALRHIGMVHRRARESGDPRYASASWYRILLAAALPREASPAGVALQRCLHEAQAGGRTDAAVASACVEARSFASKGLVAPDIT